MKKKLYIVLFTSLIFATCKKKELPIATSGDPEFYVKGNINGEDVNLQAGTLQYYMYTSAYFDSTLNLGGYRGELKQLNCNKFCGYGLSFLINDVAAGANSFATSPDSALKPGIYYFSDQNNILPSYTAQFVPQRAVVPGATYKWTITDGSNQVVYNTYSVTVEFAARKNYKVTFEYIDPSGNCVKELTKTYNTFSLLQSAIKVEQQQPLSGMRFLFSAMPRGKAPYTYVWNFGDGSPVSTHSTPEHSYVPSVIPYQAHVKITDARGDTCSANYQVLAMLPPDNLCESNFNCKLIPKPDPRLFKTVSIALTNDEAKEYSTNETLQPVNSRFEIVRVEKYKDNEKGEPTCKITARFSCQVKNGSSFINISNAEAVFAVSYRK